jgi:protein-disulfide isomerase
VDAYHRADLEREDEERALFRQRARAVGSAGVPSLASVLRAVDAADAADERPFGGGPPRRAGLAARWRAASRSARVLAAASVVAAAAVALVFLARPGRVDTPSLIAADTVQTVARAPGADDSPAAPEVVSSLPIAGAPSRGPAGASITIVEFADFECPFCARAEVTLHALERRHPGDVRVVYKNLPLRMHPHARLAAKAALAAEAQGRFWEFHDRLYAHGGGAPDRAVLERIAADLRLDGERFSRDLDDPALEARVAADERDAAALGVEGTPTFYVNGRRINGAFPLAVFEAAIAKGRAP